MNGILFTPTIWQGKLKAIESLGYAVTRRLLKAQPALNWDAMQPAMGGSWCFYQKDDPDFHGYIQPRYHVGQVVYVKEAWATEAQYDHLAPRDIPQTAHIHYMSDGVGEWPLNLQIGKWRSPMFLRECHARYFIRILEIRPERLNEITEEDAIAEGIPSDPTIAIYEYSRLWDSINPKAKWATNPWCWRILFKLAERPK